MFSKSIKFLSSLRFTIVLITLLGVIFAVGLWVPQKRLLKSIYLDWQQSSPDLVAFLDALGLTTVYTAPLTVTLWVLFFVNLSLVMWQRLPVIAKRIAISEERIADPEQAPGYGFKRSYPLPEALSDQDVLAALRKKGYTLLGEARGGFYGVKNRLAPVAFALFHLSFFLILLGGLISVYTEFVGYLDLAEGESFQGEIERYVQDPMPKMPALGEPPQVSFHVKSIEPEVVRNTPTGIKVLLLEKGGGSHLVDINVPWDTGASSFVFKHLGMAPLFVLKDASGRELDGAYVKLDVVKGKLDKFGLGGLEFLVRFYPDHVLKDGKHSTRSMEFKNPTFALSVVSGGKKLAEGTIVKGGALEFPGYRLEMPDQRFWVRFHVVKQHGLPVLYLGFALATVGVIWRLLFYRREMLGAVRDQGGGRCLVVAARSEYYKSLAEDEFSALFGGIAGQPEQPAQDADSGGN
jgi:hypothetical protein